MPGIAPQVGDVLTISNVWVCAQQTAYNTMHYLVSGVTNGGATIKDVAKYFATAAALVAKDVVPTSAQFEGTTCRNLVTPQTRTAKWQEISKGVVVGGVTPKQVAAIISIYSALSGPKNRGRIYMPFVPATFVDTAGALNNAGFLAYGLALSNLIPIAVTVDGQGGTISLSLVIRHGHGPIANPVPPGTFTIANETFVQNKLGTQRRRGDYGRINAPGF